MKRNSPFGVGRLMRAAICGLLAATVIPAAASAEAMTTTAPFMGPIDNTCVFPTETVVLNAHAKITTITQSDGTIATLVSMGGTGLTLTGVKYSFSDESRLYILGGPGDSDFSFYHYQKLTRAGETGSSLLGGDDFYLRMFISIPPGSAGVPSDGSLNTNTMAFDCR